MTEPTGERVTTAEIGRRLDLFRDDVRDDLQQIRDDIRGLKFVGLERYEAEQAARDQKMQALRDEVKAQDDKRATDRRLVLTSLLFPILVAIIGSLLYSAMGGV